MKKSIFSLLSILFFSSLCYATDNLDQEKTNTPTQQENDSNAAASNQESEEIAQGDRNVSPRSNARWYKSREARREYLKGGSDYPRKPVQSDEPNRNNFAQDQNVPRSDARWYNSRRL
jgi:hypothetical protein